MGKSKPFYSKEKIVNQRTVNSSPSARNLKKDELGAVIFGTKNHTKEECLQKNLFGLPAPYFSFVKNISPGLPIFLFNASDRMIHGIFEAITQGQMYIDSTAWTESEGTALTQYPAQVRVRTVTRCSPLSEDKFKPAISRNYYTDRFFWFELDKEQTETLFDLFSPSPLSVRVTQPPNACLVEKKPDSGMQKMSFADIVKNSASSMEGKNDIVLESDPGFASSSFQTNKELCPYKLDSEFNSHVSGCWENWEADDQANNISESKNFMGGESDSLGHSWFEKTSFADIVKNSASSMKGKNDIVLESDPGFASSSFQTNKELCPYKLDTEFNSHVLECWEDWEDGDQANNISESKKFLNGDTDSLGQPGFEPIGARAYEEPPISTSGKAFELESVIYELKEEVERLKVSDSYRSSKIKNLEKELANSKVEIGKLKKRLWALDLKSGGSDGSSSETSRSSNLRFDESVFIIGGYNGVSWLRDLGSYSPYNDVITPLCPMTSLRSYASVGKLNSEVYVFGGFHDNEWHDTVESYNPNSDEWIQRPSLNQKKGNMAGVSLDDKIFAIGGGTQVLCLPDVEFFDINLGRWISSQSMLERLTLAEESLIGHNGVLRSALGAVTLNGAIYVTGGFDGNSYLKTVERFDPRECAWRKLGSMNSRRGDHCLMACDEKIYAIGGCREDTAISTTEVLDVRAGRWMNAESLSVPRAAMCSFVTGRYIYAIGGADTDLHNTMEFYDVDHPGWQMTGTTAIGKRSFFSAIVL